MDVILEALLRDSFPVALVAFVGWFLVTKLWPFFTKEYWPAMRDRSQHQQDVLTSIQKAMIEISVASRDMTALLAQHDRDSREQFSAIALLLSGSDLRIKKKESNDAKANPNPVQSVSGAVPAADPATAGNPAP